MKSRPPVPAASPSRETPPGRPGAPPARPPMQRAASPSRPPPPRPAPAGSTPTFVDLVGQEIAQIEPQEEPALGSSRVTATVETNGVPEVNTYRPWRSNRFDKPSKHNRLIWWVFSHVQKKKAMFSTFSAVGFNDKYVYCFVEAEAAATGASTESTRASLRGARSSRSCTGQTPHHPHRHQTPAQCVTHFLFFHACPAHEFRKFDQQTDKHGLVICVVNISIQSLTPGFRCAKETNHHQATTEAVRHETWTAGKEKTFSAS